MMVHGSCAACLVLSEIFDRTERVVCGHVSEDASLLCVVLPRPKDVRTDPYHVGSVLNGQLPVRTHAHGQPADGIAKALLCLHVKLMHLFKTRFDPFRIVGVWSYAHQSLYFDMRKFPTAKNDEISHFLCRYRD